MRQRLIKAVLAALFTGLGVAAAPALAQQMPAWESQLYEAAKKEKEFTVYTTPRKRHGYARRSTPGIPA